ncbi:3'(2'),5'-bisphosphate nucleotidase CysQ [Pseudoxanthobacter sp.]|uniref:3'(2'),5'-bisphosphate nucleotidase CysQ n=1 Tax=Pseudoxanthobacter sp. TaxID=1925742 RepID=UPI002FE00557
MTTTAPEAARLPELMALAVEAGEAILALYCTDCAVKVKADASPVTEADARAEAVILAGLARLFPDIPVVAEEECAAGRIPPTDGLFFLVDPLDGTREFLSRNGEFTVNIALIRDGVPVLGVVHAPALGVLYAGTTLGAAPLAIRATVTGRAVGAPVPVAVRAAPAEGLAAIGSRSHGAAETGDWLKRFRISSFVAAGSSLKFCLVAEGRADIYPRIGRTMEWDTAAGDAVLRAAGGLVTTFDGAPFVYGKRVQAHDAPYANPHFVAFGDRSLIAAAFG